MDNFSSSHNSLAIIGVELTTFNTSFFHGDGAGRAHAVISNINYLSDNSMVRHKV